MKTGELNWAKNNTYSFNSDIKKYKDKMFVVDYENTLRCYKILDGEECWNLQTEDSFTISNIKYSLILLNDSVIFSNSIGDITAVDIETGIITWQLPTQNSSIINEIYNFKISKIVSDGNSLFFSNNKNEFYSIDVKTGATNWINKIKSNIKPMHNVLSLFISPDAYFISNPTLSIGEIPFSILITLINSDPLSFKFSLFILSINCKGKIPIPIRFDL